MYAFFLLLLPSAFACSLATIYYSSMVFSAFLLVLGANIIFALRATLTHGVSDAQIVGDSIQLVLSKAFAPSAQSKQTSLENALLVESSWISPDWGLVKLKSDNKKTLLLLLSPLTVSNHCDLRRFRVHCSHNKKLKLNTLESLSL